MVDLVASDDKGRSVLVSVKWQQVSGTAEQKVPYEVISLARALESAGGIHARAYLVLGGKGWTLRDFYTSGGLSTYMQGTEKVEIITLEDFIAKANRRQL